LGVVLYELLVGAHPFDEQRLRHASLLEAWRVIREEDPPKPSTRFRTLAATGTGSTPRPERDRLTTRLRGDLDWITMKALEKDRNRRYESAGDFALDLQRHLRHEPVLATPPGTTYIVSKLVRRHRVPLIAGGVVLLAIIAGGVTSTVLYFKAQRAAAIARQERDRSDEVATMMKEMLKGAGPSVALGRDTRLLRDLLDTTVRRLEAEGSASPLVRSEMLGVIGATYMDLGEYEAAGPPLETALAIRRTASGERDPEALALTAATGQLQYRLGNMAAAESLLDWSGRAQAEVVGPENEATLSTRVALVETLGYMGKLNEADSLGTPLLATLRRVAGDTAEVTRSAMFALAQTYTDLDRLADAESLYLEQRDILLRTVGPGHPTTLSMAVNLGWLYRLEGRLPEAEAETRTALADMRRLLGNDHAETQVAVNNLGIILSDAGRPREAEAYYIEGLEHGRRVLGDKHPETLASMVNLATFSMKSGHCDRARPLLDEAIASFEETMTDAIGLGIAHSVRAECRLKSGRRADALADFMEARRILSEIFPADHPRLKRVEDGIRAAGGVARRAGQFDRTTP
ncbi:MAG TPA: tetratricopeptide repeat protein, partial [Candidatus Eisenbacteria bacterium]